MVKITFNPQPMYWHVPYEMTLDGEFLMRAATREELRLRLRAVKRLARTMSALDVANALVDQNYRSAMARRIAF